MASLGHNELNDSFRPEQCVNLSTVILIFMYLPVAVPTSTGVTSVPVHGVKRTHSGTTKSSQSIEMVSLDANHITKPPAAPHATTPITTAATNVTVTGTSASCTLPPYATMTSKSVTMLLAQTLANRAMQQQLANWQKMQQAGGKAPAETSAASTAPSTGKVMISSQKLILHMLNWSKIGKCQSTCKENVSLLITYTEYHGYWWPGLHFNIR